MGKRYTADDLKGVPDGTFIRIDCPYKNCTYSQFKHLRGFQGRELVAKHLEECHGRKKKGKGA